jgi:hypothetical protein
VSIPTINAAADYFGISIEDLMGRSRQRHLVIARCAVSFVMRERDELSFPMIGRRLGGRDHTTIMHQIDRAREMIDEDIYFAAFIRAQMALPKHSPEAIRLKIPLDVQKAFQRLKPRPDAIDRPMSVLHVGRRMILVDDDGMSIDDHQWRRDIAEGSNKLRVAIRRQHPDRCAA